MIQMKFNKILPLLFLPFLDNPLNASQFQTTIKNISEIVEAKLFDLKRPKRFKISKNISKLLLSIFCEK